MLSFSSLKERILLTILRSILLLLASHCFGQEISNHIHIDQFGYFENAEKVAVISDPQIGYNSNDSYTPGSQLEVRHFYTDANYNQQKTQF